MFATGTRSWKRREAKGLRVGVTAREGRRALQPAALWLHGEEGRTRAEVDELIPRIDPVLKAMNWPGGSARDFLHTIRDESGLLTGWDQEHYGFMHLGFQEYLAAREIRSRAFDDPGVLSELGAHFGGELMAGGWASYTGAGGSVSL